MAQIHDFTAAFRPGRLAAPSLRRRRPQLHQPGDRRLRPAASSISGRPTAALGALLDLLGEAFCRLLCGGLAGGVRLRAGAWRRSSAPRRPSRWPICGGRRDRGWRAATPAPAAPARSPSSDCRGRARRGGRPARSRALRPSALAKVGASLRFPGRGGAVACSGCSTWQAHLLAGRDERAPGGPRGRSVTRRRCAVARMVILVDRRLSGEGRNLQGRLAARRWCGSSATWPCVPHHP